MEILNHEKDSLQLVSSLPLSGSICQARLERMPAPGGRSDGLTSLPRPPPTLQGCDLVTWGLLIEQMFIELLQCDTLCTEHCLYSLQASSDFGPLVRPRPWCRHSADGHGVFGRTHNVLQRYLYQIISGKTLHDKLALPFIAHHQGLRATETRTNLLRSVCIWCGI